MGCSNSKHGETTKGGRVGVAPGLGGHAPSQSVLFDSHDEGAAAAKGTGAGDSGSGGAAKANGHGAGHSSGGSSRSLQTKGLPHASSAAKLNGSRIVPPLSSPNAQSKLRQGKAAAAAAIPGGDELEQSPAAAQWMRSGASASSNNLRGKRGSLGTGAGPGAGAGATIAAATRLGAHALDDTGAMSPASDGVMVGSGLGGKGRLHDLKSPLIAAAGQQNSKSAYFNREGKPALPPGAGSGLLRRLPSDASKHAESRVMMALTSKKLAMQRQRRLQIKGESYRDVLLSIAKDSAREGRGSPRAGDTRAPPSASSRSSAKTQGQRELIVNSLRSHFLMASVAGDDLDKVVAAMESMVVRTGTEIITQGDDGDRFYVIERGAFEVFVDGQKVATLEAGANFGELALMYNCPRAATVTAVSAGILWCLDRTTFRSIILRATNQALEDNRRWLKRVSLLARLHPRHINKLADALQPVRFKAGDTVITQGETGDVFYLVKSGTVIVSQLIEEDALRTPAGMAEGDGQGRPASPAVVGSLSNEELVIMELGEGEHFGERALLTQERRAATVKAKTDAVLMALDRDSFEELLGPVEDVMEVTHSQRRLAAARVHLEREESIKSLKAAHAANSSSTRAAATHDRSRSSSGGEETKQPTIRERKLRSDCVLANLRPVAVLGEGAFGVVQLVEHMKTKEMFALKQMQKARIVKTGQERNVCNEKKLLASTDHPFILKLVNAFKDQNCLYLVLEFLQGGDMFGHLYKQGGKFNTPTSVFYAATVLTVFEHLHAQHIVYRDLKPENLVLDSRGFLKVVDFGFAKEVRDRTYTLCGTPEYLAPELVQGKGHNKMVDYWALGILIYEMLQGYSPFADEDENNQLTVYKNIIRGDVVFSSRLRDKTGIALVQALLVANPAQRLGSGREGIKAIMGHAWFQGVQWKALMRKRVLPPIIPQVSNKYDVSNFDEVNVEARNIVPYKDNGTGWDADF